MHGNHTQSSCCSAHINIGRISAGNGFWTYEYVDRDFLVIQVTTIPLEACNSFSNTLYIYIYTHTLPVSHYVAQVITYTSNYLCTGIYPQHRSPLTSAPGRTSYASFEASFREFLDKVVIRFTRHTIPAVNRDHFFMNILRIESFSHRNRTAERCSSVIYSSSTVASLTTETIL
jgi:hypothetical protein